jgi:hypothetical protein
MITSLTRGGEQQMSSIYYLRCNECGVADAMEVSSHFPYSITNAFGNTWDACEHGIDATRELRPDDQIAPPTDGDDYPYGALGRNIDHLFERGDYNALSKKLWAAQQLVERLGNAIQELELRAEAGEPTDSSS